MQSRRDFLRSLLVGTAAAAAAALPETARRILQAPSAADAPAAKGPLAMLLKIAMGDAGDEDGAPMFASRSTMGRPTLGGLPFASDGKIWPMEVCDAVEDATIEPRPWREQLSHEVAEWPELPAKPLLYRMGDELTPGEVLFSPGIKYVTHEAPPEAAPRVSERDLAEWSSPPLPEAGPWTLARVEFFGIRGVRIVAEQS